MIYGRDKAGRFVQLQKPPKQLTDKEKKLIENFEKGKKMECQWIKMNCFNEYVCGNSANLEAKDMEIEKCNIEDCKYYFNDKVNLSQSVIDSENESKCFDGDGLL